MNNYEKRSNKLVEFLSGNGFYIVLLLCIAAIAVSAYILFFADNDSAEPDIAGPESLELGPASRDIPEPALDTGTREAIGQLPELPDEDSGIVAERPVIKATPAPTAAPAPTPAPTPQPSAVPIPSKAAYVWPLNGQVSVPFSINELIRSKTMNDWRTHAGIDIAASPGAKVAAIADGTVSDIYDSPFMGTTIVIDHDNDIKSVYSNLMPEVTVSKGKRVSAGDTIAGVGDTAIIESSEVPHLHLEIVENGKYIDPVSVLPQR